MALNINKEFLKLKSYMTKQDYLDDGRKDTIDPLGNDIYNEIYLRSVGVINHYTRGLITNVDDVYSSLSTNGINMLFKAIFAQMNYFVVNGPIGENAPVEASVGEASKQNPEQVLNMYFLCKEARMFLNRGGFTYSGLNKVTRIPLKNRIPQILGEED